VPSLAGSAKLRDSSTDMPNNELAELFTLTSVAIVADRQVGASLRDPGWHAAGNDVGIDLPIRAYIP
jgi:hypothetical protein